jgi:D-alanyl-D-alanine carboxypeptidase (penicillin-binding protein 5/6)
LRPLAAAFVLLLIAVGFALAPGPAGAQSAFDTKAPYAILVDYESGAVLYEKNADKPFEPASLAKLMTADIAFDELKRGLIRMDTTFPISVHAWRDGGAPSGGTTMYAEVHSNVPVADLLRGLIVQSGNDSAIALAEGIAGSEPAFVDMMNRRAAELGMKNTHFTNSNGLHDPAQMATARDLALLAHHLIATYPDYYPMFSEREFTWNKIRQLNRTPLIGDGTGFDGLKTGYIDKKSGYGIVASALRDGKRLVAVLGGLESDGDREAETKKLVDWGFRNFQTVTAFQAGEVVAEASVYGGVVGRVPLKASGPIEVLIPRDAKDTLKARAVYQGPLVAPFKEGLEVGAFKVWNGDRLIQETPLYTAAAVERGPLHSRAFDAIGELLFGWL